MIREHAIRLLPELNENFILQNVKPGILMSEFLSCEVTCKINGEFTLNAVYPLDGMYADDLQVTYIIYAYADRTRPKQAFRIMSTEIDTEAMTITIECEHVSQKVRQSGFIFMNPYGSKEAPFRSIFKTVKDLAFTINSDIQLELEPAASSARSPQVYSQSVMNGLEFMAGKEGSIIDRFGGEWLQDNHKITWYDKIGINYSQSGDNWQNQVGKNHHVFRYGAQLGGVKLKIDTTDIVVGVVPYFVEKGEQDKPDIYHTLVDPEPNYHSMTFSQNVVQGKDDDGTLLIKKYPNGRYEPLDVSEEGLTPAENRKLLRPKAEEYFRNKSVNKIRPSVSGSVDVFSLRRSEDYDEIFNATQVGIGDTVTVLHPELKEEYITRITGYTFDCIEDDFKTLEFGDLERTFLDDNKYSGSRK